MHIWRKRKKEKPLAIARRIMYGNVIRYFPEATLDQDQLRGERYHAQWSTTHGRLMTDCDHVFTDEAEVLCSGDAICGII